MPISAILRIFTSFENQELLEVDDTTLIFNVFMRNCNQIALLSRNGIRSLIDFERRDLERYQKRFCRVKKPLDPTPDQWKRVILLIILLFATDQQADFW